MHKVFFRHLTLAIYLILAITSPQAIAHFGAERDTPIISITQKSSIISEWVKFRLPGRQVQEYSALSFYYTGDTDPSKAFVAMGQIAYAVGSTWIRETSPGPAGYGNFTAETGSSKGTVWCSLIKVGPIDEMPGKIRHFEFKGGDDSYLNPCGVHRQFAVVCGPDKGMEATCKPWDA